jgi:O-acetyl-ADP-ribose deacetylase (regulator of RNase III)
MGTYKEIEGDLIALAKEGIFDVISHGCNCQCNMKSGIAPLMAEAFGVSNPVFYHLENIITRGDINKLGQIESKPLLITKNGLKLRNWVSHERPEGSFILNVVNSYTQYIPSRETKPLDYDALTLCMRKINHKFTGQRIGLPKIGCGLAGGSWEIVSEIIKRELKDCDVTIVILPQTYCV